MSLMPTREESAFGDGYQQASEAGGMVIDHLMKRLNAVEAERAVLKAALTEIASQKTTDDNYEEYGEDFVGDYEGGYDAIIRIARAALNGAVGNARVSPQASNE